MVRVVGEGVDNEIHSIKDALRIADEHGLDLVEISLKRLVDQIVLISGDSDFIPAISADKGHIRGIIGVPKPMVKKIENKIDMEIALTEDYVQTVQYKNYIFLFLFLLVST